MATSAAEVRASSPMFAANPAPLPRLFVSGQEAGSDLNASGGGTPRDLIRTLNPRGYWPTPLRATSNPYIGPGSAEAVAGDFRTTHVGDPSDTSPFNTDDPVTGISTATYIANMARLISALTP